MVLVIKHSVNRVKNGFAARSPELRLTAHGHSPEVARRNLEHLALHLLRPFERTGRLREEVQRAGVEVRDEGEGLEVQTTEE